MDPESAVRKKGWVSLNPCQSPSPGSMTLPKAETEGLLLYKVHRALEPIYAGGKCEALTVTLNSETQSRYAIMMRVGSVFTLRDAASGTPIHSLAIVLLIYFSI